MFVKADIFDHPVSFSLDEVTSVDTPLEALTASLNKYGSVDLEYMSSLIDMKEEDLIESLEGHIYYNPLVENYEIADRFIAGNVVQKAADVKAWIDKEEERIKGFPGYDDIEPFIEMSRQSLKALEDATPRKITFDELDFNFGERWIPTGIYSSYMSYLYGTDVKIAYSSSMDEYSCDARRKNMKIWEEFCVRGYYRVYDGMSLLKYALHNTVPDIKKSIGKDDDGHDIKVPDSEAIQLANTKIDEIRNGFSEWLEAQSPEFKDRLVDLYNSKFNCYVRPHYDGSHQTFPDLNMKLLGDRYGINSVYQSQKDCVWMLIQNGGGICDHQVGTGKTLIMCMAAHEMKRLGLVHKPMIIGMKANVDEIAMTYQTAYPNARILYADEKSFKAENRVAFFNQIKNNDYDCVIMSHDQFGKIPQSPDIQQQILQAELDTVEENLNVIKEQGHDISRGMLKGLLKRKENLTAKIATIQYNMEQNRDNVVDFKQMGIDHIFVDESQNFKNLMFNTRHDRVAGLGNSEGKGIGEFMSGLKKRDYETCRNTSDDLIRDVHTTCKSHPNEWYDAKFALINLQVELKHYLRELPEENADLRSLISKIIDIVAGAMETLTHLIKTITPHLPADMVISAYVPSKKTSDLNLTVKRIHLVEKIYGEYVMKVYNNGKATLPEIVNHYNETFGLKLTIDEIYDGYARIKSRGGKKDWIHDKENNIYDLAYWTRATAEAINNHIINNSSLKGGRPPTPGNVESKDLDFD